jgi:hypothetical protein
VRKHPYAKKLLLCLNCKNICYPWVWFWPPFLPNLNMLHFSTWSDLETRELTATHKNFAALRASVSKVFAPLAEEFAQKASRLCAATWSRVSPLAAVSLH